MEELMPLIFVIIVIISITTSSKRKVKQPPARPIIVQSATLDEDEEDFRRAMQPVKPAPKAQPVHSAKRVTSVTPLPQSGLLPAQPRNLNYQPLQARVVELTQEPRYVGSMGDTGSTEGMDPDHDHSLHLQLEDSAQIEGGLPPIASLLGRNELLKGVVFSEILNRPTACKWGSR